MYTEREKEKERERKKETERDREREREIERERDRESLITSVCDRMCMRLNTFNIHTYYNKSLSICVSLFYRVNYTNISVIIRVQSQHIYEVDTSDNLSTNIKR